MKALLLLLVLLLPGCLSVSVQVTYNEQMQPVSCHADYLSLARDVDSAAFNVCGNAATIQRSTSAEVLRQTLEAILRGVLP